MTESHGVSKVRIKFGKHQFEAEGPVETVQSQLEYFKQLVAPEPIVEKPEPPEPEPPKLEPPKPEPPSFVKMVLLRGSTVYLKIAAKPDQNVLLILLGQKLIRNNEAVSGTEIMNGLRASGVGSPRGDYILARHIRNGLVTVSGGPRRKRRYRLTDAGVERAQKIAQEILSLGH